MDKQKLKFSFEDFEWEGIEKIDYKPKDESAVTFSNVTRQNIFESKNGINFDARYFECNKDGYTTLEKHDHAHVVLILRGQGKVLVGKEILDVKPYDLVVIPSQYAHQLINTSDEPFGFMCTVNATRDKFRLLSRKEMDDLIKIPKVRKTIRVPNNYFSR